VSISAFVLRSTRTLTRGLLLAFITIPYFWCPRSLMYLSSGSALILPWALSSAVSPARDNVLFPSPHTPTILLSQLGASEFFSPATTVFSKRGPTPSSLIPPNGTLRARSWPYHDRRAPPVSGINLCVFSLLLANCLFVLFSPFPFLATPPPI